MAELNVFDVFAETPMEKNHNLATDSIKCMIANILPKASFSEKSDITQITSAGYTTDGYALTVIASFEQNGVYNYSVSDLVMTASGGVIGPGKYFIFYNDTATSRHLMFWVENPTGEFIIEDGKSIRLKMPSKLITGQWKKAS